MHSYLNSILEISNVCTDDYEYFSLCSERDKRQHYFKKTVCTTPKYSTLISKCPKISYKN